jgi:hypothetical protein
MKISRNELETLIENMLRKESTTLLEMPEMGQKIPAGSDREGGMAKQKLFHMSQQAQQLHDMLADDQELEGWVQDKISSASKDLRAIFDHIVYSATKDGPR